MNRIRLTFLLAAALFTHGCGSDDSTNPPTGGDGSGTPAPGSNPGAENTTKSQPYRFSTGKFEIQPGDTFECFYTDTITDRQLNVQSATGSQGKGGHHITVYYTDQKVPVGHHACTDVEMVGLHQIAGAADGSGSKEGIIGLPDGYATKVPAGKQLVVQTHYIRTEPGPATVEDSVELQTLADQDVKQYANSFVLNDGTFNLHARTTGKSTTDCVVPQDFNLLLLLGHMHEWGSHYKLDHVDETGKVITTLYETDWDPIYMSHPPVNNYAPEKPLKLTKGMRLRQTCDWQNSEDTEMQFPREMCVMFSYYVPDNGFIICDTKEVK